MRTRFVRAQLLVFALASIIGLSTMFMVYLQVPTLLGWGRITVQLELPAGGGLYQLSNVTYRGSQIGKVTALELTADGARATLSLDPSPPVPADLIAEVRSVSAIGEQYVDLRPQSSAPPYLRNGSVIAREHTRIPQPVGPMLDQVSALLGSVPRDKLGALLDESATGFDDAGFDLTSLINSAGTIARDFEGVSERARTLVDDAVPLLDASVAADSATRVWSRSLAGVTDMLRDKDGQVRTILERGPDTLNEVSRLMDSVKPTLPVLLANLTSLGQVGMTYLPSLEQLLVLIPPYFANMQAIAPTNNATGLPLANFRMQMSDPPACTVGFLPPSQWRSPSDTTTVDTPDGLYCKLPQDSPILVRGARNLPCMAKPGKRAPTVEICDSDKPYMPLAMRQHPLGPTAIDPNLLGQGIPTDSRVTNDDQIFGPVEGTPPPGGNADPPPGGNVDPPPGGNVDPPPGGNVDPPPGGNVDPPPAEPGTVPVAPSSSVTTYDPRTGRYMAPDGTMRTQQDLVAAPAASGWQELVLDREYVES